jgi:hypothetical protein
VKRYISQLKRDKAPIIGPARGRLKIRMTGLGEKSAIWKSAEDALVAGDDATLDHLLREYEKMFRTEQPRSSWFGGLTPDYKDGEARAARVS